jgi:GTPase SAR1 family protein
MKSRPTESKAIQSGINVKVVILGPENSGKTCNFDPQRN